MRPVNESELMSVMRSVRTGVAARGLFQVVWKLAAFGTGVLIVRAMPAEEAGKFFFAISVSSVVALVGGVGLAQAVLRRLPHVDATGDRSSGDGLFLGALRMVIVSGLLVAAIGSATGLISRSDLGIPLMLGSLIGGAMCLQGVSSSFLRARGSGGLVEIWQAAVPTLFLMALAGSLPWIALDSTDAVLLRLSIELLAAVALLVNARRQTDKSAATDVGGLARLALPLWITALAWLCLEQADVVILGLLRDPAAVGIYAPILKAAETATLPLVVVVPYVLVATSRLNALGRFEDIHRVHAVVAKLVLTLTVPVVSALFLAPDLLIGTIFGIDHPRTDSIARILAIVFIVHGTLGLTAPVLEAVGEVRKLVVRSVLALGIGIAADLILIGRIGALGAALGSLVAYVAMSTLNSLLVFRQLHITPWRNGVLWTLVAACSVTILLWRLGFADNSFLHLLGAVAVVTGATSLVAWLSADEKDRTAIVSALTPPHRLR